MSEISQRGSRQRPWLIVLGASALTSLLLATPAFAGDVNLSGLNAEPTVQRFIVKTRDAAPVGVASTSAAATSASLRATLARDRGMQVVERQVTIDEWRDGVASGAIAEVFACGTAAVVTPIGQLKGKDFEVGDLTAPAGPVTLSLRQELTDIQYGRVADRHGWLLRLG